MFLSLPFILESPNKKMMGQWYSQKKSQRQQLFYSPWCCDLSVQMGCFRQRAMRGDFQLYWEAVCCDWFKYTADICTSPDTNTHGGRWNWCVLSVPSLHRGGRENIFGPVTYATTLPFCLYRLYKHTYTHCSRNFCFMTSNIRCEAQRKSLVYTTATVQFCITDEVYNASSMENIKKTTEICWEKVTTWRLRLQQEMI